MCFDLVSNALYVVFLCGTVIWLDLSLRKKYSPYLLGVVFGFITIFVIKHRTPIDASHFYDFRNIIMTMAGFIGGPLTAGIAAVISSIYRYNVYGNGSMGGIASIIVFACFGSLLGISTKNHPTKKALLFWLYIGLVMACISLFIIAFIPPGKSYTATVPGVIAISILIINPLATTIIFNFYFWAYDFLSRILILNTIINYSPICLTIFDNKGIIMINQQLETLCQSSQKFEELFQLPNSTPTCPDTIQQHKEITTEDKRRYVADLASFQMPNGRCAWVAIVNDVTERRKEQERLKRAAEQLTRQLKLEADLSQSNQLIADIINNMPDPFYVLDNRWRFTFVNNKAEELLQKSREELLGGKIWAIIPQTQGSLSELYFKKAKKDCLPITFEGQCLLNEDIWHQVTAYPSQLGLSVYYRDITEQKIARENLIKSQKEMSLILESMTDCFYALDRDLCFTYINRAAELAFGKKRNELLGVKITEIFKSNATALSHYQKVINEKEPITFEIISEALGNRWLELNLYPIETGMTCYFRDISSRKMAQEEMARLDRLNLVGQLAAGIAHEIRNPMTTVRGYLQLLSERPVFSGQKPTFELMIAEIDRANSIITEFLSLARTKQTDLKLQNLNDIINNLYPILEADTYTQNKQIYFTPSKIPNLNLNKNEISQLILNLIRNGLESMEEGGSIIIKSYIEGDNVVLEIKDEGCGIPLENLKKIGTPFFTTKDSGTGLGLATCFKIAESHNAKIHINSSPNGTAVRIFFPISNNS